MIPPWSMTEHIAFLPHGLVEQGPEITGIYHHICIYQCLIFNEFMWLFKLWIGYLCIVRTKLHPPPKNSHSKDSRQCKIVDSCWYNSHYKCNLSKYLYLLLLIPENGNICVVSIQLHSSRHCTYVLDVQDHYEYLFSSTKLAMTIYNMLYLPSTCYLEWNGDGDHNCYRFCMNTSRLTCHLFGRCQVPVAGG